MQTVPATIVQYSLDSREPCPTVPVKGRFVIFVEFRGEDIGTVRIKQRMMRMWNKYKLHAHRCNGIHLATSRANVERTLSKQGSSPFPITVTCLNEDDPLAAPPRLASRMS